MKGDGKLMDREEMRKELKSQMEELLRAAERLGFSFTFHVHYTTENYKCKGLFYMFNI